MITSEDETPDFGWIFFVLDEHGPIQLPCFYYDPGEMFNLQGVTKPEKHQLDEFFKEQLSLGTLQLSDADGNKIVNYAEEIDIANYIPPSDRKHSPRIERSKTHDHD